MRPFLISILLMISVLLSTLLLRPVHACEPETSENTVSLEVEISALYPNPNSGESEWIELSNRGEELIELSFYTLEDETAKPWTLSGTLEESITLTDLPFQLNNDGDTVILKTLDGTVVDSFTYSSSKKGEILKKSSEETADAVEDAAEDETNGADTASEENSEASTPSTPSSWPIFSEALPNPEGSDSTNEWIELYNPHEETLSLEGLYLDDEEGGSSPYALSGTLAAESYLVIGISESSITLNNDEDHVRLLGVSGEVLWDLSYENSKEGYSYARFGEEYAWTDEPTPGEENSPGESDEEANQETNEETSYENGDLSDEVEISEVYPNPEGPDAEEEWIEITNGGSEAVNLGNWTIDDGEGGSDPYTFPDDTIIEPGETLVIYRTESGIALNNNDETVELRDYAGETVDEISYDKSQENQSYAEIQVEEVESLQASASGLGTASFSTWQWVQPSPGVQNPIWKQISGEVLEWDGEHLTLFDGVSTWTFKTIQALTDALIFEIGNRVLVQIEENEGLYEVRYSELLESAQGVQKNHFPWSWLITAFLLLIYLGNEYHKRRKALHFNGLSVP